jgi:hypothetical protein
VLDSA